MPRSLSRTPAHTPRRNRRPRPPWSWCRRCHGESGGQSGPLSIWLNECGEVGDHAGDALARPGPNGPEHGASLGCESEAFWAPLHRRRLEASHKGCCASLSRAPLSARHKEKGSSTVLHAVKPMRTRAIPCLPRCALVRLRSRACMHPVCNASSVGHGAVPAGTPSTVSTTRNRTRPLVICS